MTSYSVTPASQLAETDWTAWAQIQQAVPELDSPFFHPALVRHTAEVRDDVEVAIIRQAGQPAGFFPFQRGADNSAQAVTGRLSEFHGVVARPEARWSPEELLRATGLKSWHFDHLPVSQAAFASHVWGTTASPCMNLADGYAAWRQEVRKSGSTLSQVERKGRKLERELGPLRFEFHTDSARAFSSLIDWKTAQHERTGVLPIFRTTTWVADLLQLLRDSSDPDFAAPFSALYAGETLLAVHLGLLGRNALHIWFPAYDPTFEKYSPGLVLLLRLAEEAAERGVTRIDFGRGEERYKASLSNDEVLIAEGKVSRSSLSTAVHAAWYRTKRRIRSSRWRRQLELPLTLTRRLRQRLAFH